MESNLKLSAIHTTESLSAMQLAKGMGTVVNESDIADFVNKSYSLKPETLFLPELIWKFSIRNVLRSENILFIGMAGAAKTYTAHCLVDALNRPFFNIPLGSTQDPRSSLIGNVTFSKETGTKFVESYFINAIRTPNAIILLDEISRAHPEAWNLLMPVLDKTQRFLRVEEQEDGMTIPVAEGVSFVATANVGAEFTSTRVLDRALLDRFTIVEIPSLDVEEETALLKQRFPNVEDKLLRSVSEIATTTRAECRTEGSPLTTAISTRAAINVAGVINDGFTLMEAAEVTIFPFFSKDGGNESERTYMRQLVQKFDTVVEPAQEEVAAEPSTSDDLFSPEEIAAASK